MEKIKILAPVTFLTLSLAEADTGAIPRDHRFALAEAAWYIRST
jgi:hypothetical protein